MKSIVRDVFPDRLAQMREKKGLSQADLGQRSGLQISAISHFEKGRRMPSAGNLQRLADALGVSTDYLLGRESDPVAAGPAISRLLRDYAQMSADDQENLVRFASMLATKRRT